MLMTLPPAFHVWKFLMDNMILTNSDLNMHGLTSLVIKNHIRLRMRKQTRVRPFDGKVLF